MAKIINSSNFQTEVVNSDKPVLLDFWAEWCGPCRMVSPVIDKLSQEFASTAVVGKVNVDEQNELASKFGVMSIPTVVLMKNGKVLNQAVGVRDYSFYAKMLSDAM